MADKGIQFLRQPGELAGGLCRFLGPFGGLFHHPGNLLEKYSAVYIVRRGFVWIANSFKDGAENL